jgi:hypothetical protein
VLRRPDSRHEPLTPSQSSGVGVPRNGDVDSQQVLSRWTEAMRRGDFEAAWRETERIEIARRRPLSAGACMFREHHLLWDGRPFDGQHVVIRCNHGLGDTLQFLRFVPRVTERACNVTTLVQPPLVTLLRQTRRIGNVLDGWQDPPLPPERVEIEVMELAYAFRSTLDDLPPPLDVELDRLRARTGMLVPRLSGKGMRVGLIWRSSDWDTTRSIPLDVLAPLRTLRHVDFFSLQQGGAASATSEAPFHIDPLHRQTQAIVDAAAAMLALDLIITVDGMAAHLAGTLRRPVWVLLKYDADWRWMSGRCDSPWYPTMRLFRQSRANDWHDVSCRLVEALRALSQP